MRKESHICPEGAKFVEKGAYPLLMVGGNYGEKIKTLAQDMLDTMYANDGIGLAACQV